jgi:hypothetical protein
MSLQDFNAKMNKSKINKYINNNTLPDTGISSNKIKKNTRSQSSPHLQKMGRLDFSLREHEGEVKA